MEAGEIKVKVKVDGADEAAKKVKSVEVSFQGVKKMALETKVAIGFAVNELKKFITSGFDVTKTIEKTAALTGMSTNSIQRFGNAMEKAGYTAKEAFGSIESMADKLAGTGTRKGGPGELANINDTLRKIGVQYISRGEIVEASKNGKWEPIIGQLSQLAQAKEIPRQRRIEMLRDLGWSDNMIAAAMMGKLSPGSIAGANKQIIGNASQKDLNNVTEAGEVLTGAKVGANNLLLKSISAGVEGFKNFKKQGEENKKSIENGDLDNVYGEVMFAPSRAMPNVPKVNPIKQNLIIPKVQAPTHHQQPHQGKADIKINLYFQGNGDNAQEVASETSKAVKDAFRQIPLQVT